MRRNSTFGVRGGSVYESGGSDPIQSLEAPVTILDATGGTDEQLVLSGDSIAKTSAPSRGVVSRDNICFAWGEFSVDVTANTATLNEGHNVSSVTWTSDTTVDVVFHNTASAAQSAVLTDSNGTVSSGATSKSASGFTFNRGSGASNWTGWFAVYTKDLT